MIQEKGKWREICEAMVRELDPAKLSVLAAQLVAALDEQNVGVVPQAKAIQAESPKSQSNSGSSDASARSSCR